MCDCALCKAVAKGWGARPDHVYPYTIVPARYGGVYEGGQILCFPVDPTIIWDLDWDAGDIECSEFWGTHAHLPIGKGPTLQDAFDHMKYLLENPEDEFTAWVRHVRDTTPSQE